MFVVGESPSFLSMKIARKCTTQAAAFNDHSCSEMERPQEKNARNFSGISTLFCFHKPFLVEEEAA